MGTTRTDWDAFQLNRRLVLDALRDNPGDYFSAKEILSFMPTTDLTSLQVGKILGLAHEEGLVAKKREGNQHAWAILPAGLAWQPQPYDWRRSKRDAQPAAPLAASPDHHSKHATTPTTHHPWVVHPAVAPPVPKPAPITRPLPIHLESPSMPPPLAPPLPTDTDMTSTLTQFLLAEADAEPATTACCGHCHPEDDEAREHYIQLLLTLADQAMERDPIWLAARRMAPHFDLATSYL